MDGSTGRDDYLTSVTMRDLADHIISIANSQHLTITNLQLQKILFFSFGFLIAERRHLAESMYDEPFRRWSYGPLIEGIYFKYAHFGGRSIMHPSAIRNETFSVLDERIEQLLCIDSFRLVEFTHRFPSWARYREAIELHSWTPPYEIDDFVREFRTQFN